MPKIVNLLVLTCIKLALHYRARSRQLFNEKKEQEDNSNTLLQKAGVRHKKELAEVKSKHGNEMAGTKRKWLGGDRNTASKPKGVCRFCVVAKVMQVICVFITTKQAVPRRRCMVSNIR